MKYMNYLRKLALLSSLALSFAVYGDGTLPLPMQSDPTSIQPLVMTDLDQNIELKIGKMAKVVSAQPSVNKIQPCATTDQFYAANGTVSVLNQAMTVLGICKATSPMKRIVVAIDNANSSNATQYILLDGSIDNASSLTKFAGTIKNKLLVPALNGNSDAEVEAAIAAKTFVLNRTSL